uniref:RRM domain-containing protein n=2 Tax=Aegilops tauschii subsp. strangulata TaxID=200361 RepID=A0A453CWW7_AEGTS
MALSLARSPHPAAAAPSLPRIPGRISQYVPLLHSPRRPYPGLRLRLPAAAVAASSPPEAPAAEPAAAAEGDEELGETRRKLFVGNMPFTFSAAETEKLFAECGVVKDVEVIKMKDGRKRGFAFVTMATAEEAAAAAEKFDGHVRCHGKDHQGGIFKELQKTCSTTISGHHSREVQALCFQSCMESKVC